MGRSQLIACASLPSLAAPHRPPGASVTLEPGARPFLTPRRVQVALPDASLSGFQQERASLRRIAGDGARPMLDASLAPQSSNYDQLSRFYRQSGTDHR